MARFGWRWTLASLRQIGDAGLRRSGSDEPLVTDNGNLIADLSVDGITDPASLDRALTSIPGVLETGLFHGMTTMALVADGATVRRLRAEAESG